MRRTALTLLAVALVALAGCGGGDGTTTTPDATTTTTPDTTTTTPAGTPTTTGTGTTPTTTGTTATETTPATTGTTATGTTPATTGTTATTTPPAGTTTGTTTPDGDRLGAADSARFLDALEAAGSFTTVERLRVTNETQTFLNATTRSRLNLAAGVGRSNDTGLFSFFGSPEVDRYTSGDTTYVRERFRFGNQSGVQYRRGTEPYGDDVEPVTLENVVGEPAPNQTETAFRRVGTETYDGVAVTRYEATGEDLEVLFNESALPENVTVESASGTMLVDGEGVFRYFGVSIAYVVDGERLEVTVERVVRRVGSTTVSEPPWLDEARAATGG